MQSTVVIVSGTGPTGRPYVVEGANEQEAWLEEINHIFWAATGREYKNANREKR